MNHLDLELKRERFFCSIPITPRLTFAVGNEQ
jgi:hypothetical protein